MTALAPPLDALFEAPGTVIVPGLLRGLGITVTRPDTEPEETWEAFCARISEAAS